MSWIESKYVPLVGAHLTLFKQSRDRVWNFRCPVCGDSRSDRTKCRGYIYEAKGDLRFHCHRCGNSMPLGKFIEYVSPALYKEYKMELFKERSNNPFAKPAPKKPTHKFKRRAPIQVERTLPPELDGFETVSKLPEDHLVAKYVMGRMIPKNAWKRILWCDRMKDISSRIPGYERNEFDHFPRLLLPFINADGKMTHIQGRAIGDDVPKGSRYITLELEEDAPKIFGMDSIDPSLPVKVVEGPIDSLFLKNCVGMGGADVDYSMFDPANTIFIYDNEPRSSQIIKRMKKTVDLGFRVCVWGSKIRHNDINDMVQLGGITPADLDRYIDDRSKKGLPAQMAINAYKK